jgi:predicted phage terminase large subunit-like protein
MVAITNEELVEAIKVDQQLLKDKWLHNLFVFNRDCLNVEHGKEKVKLAQVHKEMCEFVDKYPRKQKLMLVPRGFLKSTLITIGKSLQWICEDPSVRILIANATYSMAVAFLNVIKRQLTNNSLLQEIFGNLVVDPDKWSESAITLRQAKEVMGGEKEATVLCYGMGGNLVSQHYDKIILDDVVNKDTISTRDQIEKTIQFYRECQPLLEKNGEMIVIGTRWAEQDLYDWIMDKENGVIQEFNVFFRRALDGELWDDNLKKFVKGTSLWPEKYNLDDFSKERRKDGPYFFSSQYFNEPFPSEDADFKREWFKYYDTSDLKGADLNRYTLIDPAISLEKTADYTGLVTVGIDNVNNVYILDIVRDRLKVNELNNLIFQQYERWHPLSIGIEDVAFQRALRYSLKQEEDRRKRWLPIVELKPYARSKDQRIKGVQPLYANGKVLHNKELVYNVYLEDELTRFPNGKHDDLVDALAYSLDLMHPPVKKVTPWRKHKYLY